MGLKFEWSTYAAAITLASVKITRLGLISSQDGVYMGSACSAYWFACKFECLVWSFCGERGKEKQNRQEFGEMFVTCNCDNLKLISKWLQETVLWSTQRLKVNSDNIWTREMNINLCVSVFYSGAGSSKETVDAVQNPVGSETKGPLLNALNILHSHLHHRGARLHVPPWLQQRTLERAPHGGLWTGSTKIRRNICMSHSVTRKTKSVVVGTAEEE